uniref:Uncharacterized protein n=1 Tax=Parascaris univalens TaxID=6257 RepID=A0A915A6C9_PARUN
VDAKEKCPIRWLLGVHERMLQHAILLLLAIGVRFTVHQMAYQRDCVDLECERTTFEETITELSDANGTTDQCRGCQHCTVNGYSVCVRLRESTLRARRAPDETVGVCGCAHSIPRTCDTKPTRQKPKNASTRLFNICYLSALRSPPPPQAENRQSSVIVTIEPFWLQPYWRELRLSNLTMHYEFPVTHPENCDGDISEVTEDGQNDICSASLQIEMSEPETGNIEADVEDQFADNFYEDDGVSEVQFDRAVFAGAENVKFWYSVYVERPRQLNPRRTDSAVVDVHSVIDSSNLEFDLETRIYGFGDSQNGGNFLGDVLKWKEEGNGNTVHMNANEIDGERSLVAMENAASFDHVQKEKTAEEVAKEVDFFAADDESRPLPEGGDEEPIVAEASSDEYSNTDTSFEEETEQKENSAELSTAEGVGKADTDFRENLIDEMDNAKSDSKMDESRIYVTADRRSHELSGKSNGKNGQTDGGIDEGDGNEGTRTGSYGISALENDEDRGASFGSDDTLVDDDEQSVTMNAEREDAEEMMSNEEHRQNSDEAMLKILQQGRGRAHHRFELTTLSTAAEVGPSELKYGEGTSEEEADRSAFRDDTDAVQTVHDISFGNSIGEELAVLSTPDYTAVTTGNHSLLANATKTIFREFIDKITTKHIGLTTYALGLAILICLLILCVFCCVRKRETLCACCNGNSDRRGKELHRNGFNNSYMYTPANAQNMNINTERERLN